MLNYKNPSLQLTWSYTEKQDCQYLPVFSFQARKTFTPNLLLEVCEGKLGQAQIQQEACKQCNKSFGWRRLEIRFWMVLLEIRSWVYHITEAWVKRTTSSLKWVETMEVFWESVGEEKERGKKRSPPLIGKTHNRLVDEVIEKSSSNEGQKYSKACLNVNRAVRQIDIFSWAVLGGHASCSTALRQGSL